MWATGAETEGKRKGRQPTPPIKGPILGPEEDREEDASPRKAGRRGRKDSAAEEGAKDAKTPAAREGAAKGRQRLEADKLLDMSAGKGALTPAAPVSNEGEGRRRLDFLDKNKKAPATSSR